MNNGRCRRVRRISSRRIDVALNIQSRKSLLNSRMNGARFSYRRCYVSHFNYSASRHFRWYFRCRAPAASFAYIKRDAGYYSAIRFTSNPALVLHEHDGMFIASTWKDIVVISQNKITFLFIIKLVFQYSFYLRSKL